MNRQNSRGFVSQSVSTHNAVRPMDRQYSRGFVSQSVTMLGAVRPIDRERGYAFSDSGVSKGTRISTSLGTRVGSGFGGGYDYQSLGSVSTSGTMAITNEKATMQHLNDRLASYLETIFDTVKENAHLGISLDNARLAADDFKMKMEYELSMRQSVEADVAGLRKILDDTNVIRLHLESDIESLREELISLRKNHEEEVADFHAQIAQAGVRVDVDAPKGQDLAKIMEEMRAKYEKIALKNQEEVKAWHESQITEVQVQVTESTTALKEATSVMTDIRRRYQGLDIELQSALSLKASLEATLRDIEMRYNLEVEKYNTVILTLQEELTKLRTDIQHNTTEYERLLNIKVKLEAEIAEYRRLLDGETDFKLHDAVETKKVETKVVTVTQTLVDGKVVSESKDIKSSERA
ncbi:Keratin [Nibea albiflora]|uniref:Keratin n=1 Tax=Nibea albiflora TaxID=240163 RepID=A0ACB7ELD0_NIBAL|nr:Keratin [Nibea albiflora]